jgi:hypothetical protein
LTDFSLDRGIILGYSSIYYPNGHGVDKYNNKNIIHILKKAIFYHERNFHNTLPNVVWAYRLTPKSSLGKSPYFLVYRKEAILPHYVFFPSL